MRSNSIGLCLALAFCCLITGCSFRHSFPADPTFAPMPPPPVNRMRVFVDMEGTFYPDGWRDFIDPEKSWDADSLNAEARRRAEEGDYRLRDRLAAEEKRLLGDVASVIRGKPRVFVLIHGFNNDQAEAMAGYDSITDRIAFQPDDGMIEFFWDGYVACDFFSPAYFWFKATNSSQRAGAEGLRKILALLQPGQRAILISHSRGASVALSAFSNPARTASFKEEILRSNPSARNLAGDLIFSPPPLRLQAQQIDLIMLAPAIGEVDFWHESCTAPEPGRAVQSCDRPYRKFPPELKSIGYTVNRGDKVLKKFVGLSGYFKPTDLGYKPQLGEKLNKHYGYFFGYLSEPPHGHHFTCYTTRPNFRAMLNFIEIPTQEPPPPPPC
jgi:hypothetical protein